MSRPFPSDQVALPSDLKRANRQSILRMLRTGRTLTAAAIHQETGISRPTVMRALQHYCELGVVESLGLGDTTSQGGKKPELFRFADTKQILCLNLWPQSVTLALCGMVGDVQSVEQHRMRVGQTLEEAFQPIQAMVKDYLSRHDTDMDSLYGVALTVPGTVDYDTQLLRYNSQCPGWGTDVDLSGELRKIFGGKAFFVDNAGKAAGRAVLLNKPEYEQKRLLTLFTTWGVSSCMIERGHVLNGKDSLIGEIGHMVISDKGPSLCGCGKKGCLESVVSLRHVQNLMQGLHVDSIRELFRQSASGESTARTVVCYLAHCFAVALHNLSLAYNQEAVVFQGDFAFADSTFDEQLKKELSEFRYYPDGKYFTIEYDRRDLGLLAAQGAAERLKNRYLDSLA